MNDAELQTIYRVRNTKTGGYIEVSADPNMPGYIDVKSILSSESKPLHIILTDEQAELLTTCLKQILDNAP